MFTTCQLEDFRKVKEAKPDNIIYFNEGEIIKLADFGFSRKINSDMTKMTKGIGTEAYLPPEAKEHRDEPVPFKSDMYALGVIFHFLLTKRRPYYFEIEDGIYEIPDLYTKDFVKILNNLLKDKPEDRIDAATLF